MPTEGVGNALSNVLAAVIPGGIVLDLQTVRPPLRVEAAGQVVCELESGGFYARADANERVMMDAVRDGRMRLEAEERLEVLHRYSTGAELVADADSKQRTIPRAMRPAVAAIASECILREPCRTRRLRVLST